MKRRARIAALLLTTAMLFATTASANSAQTYWEGRDGTGAIITDENSPIIVEKEDLTFDIQSFPKLGGSNTAEQNTKSASVTAEYTFYNPADYTVTAKLLFPFGSIPDYASSMDQGQYGIRINGEPIEAKLRHSYVEHGHEFNLDEDLSRLSDGYAGDDFYSPELAVTKYVFTFEGLEQVEARDVHADILFDVDSSRTILYLENGEGGLADEGQWLGSDITGQDNTLTLYVLGEPMEELLNWRFYYWNGDENQELDLGVSITGEEQMSFLDFAMQWYDPEGEVSETDWFNAFAASFRENDSYWGHVYYFATDMEDNFMRWYEYEITLGPGERIVNAVTAPMYPDINGNYSPEIYIYTYLLSPAKTWAEFGELNIYINTPYYLTECNLEGFARTDSGYELHLDGLPAGELHFNLSTDEHPTIAHNDVGYGLTIVLLLILQLLKYLAIPVLLAVGVILIVRWIKKENES